MALRWLAVAVLGFVGAAYAFGYVLATMQGVALEPIVLPVFEPVDALGWLVVGVVLVGAVIVPHELLHGVFMARYGGEPEYGVGVAYFVLPYAYAETEGTNYTRNQLVVALLAPLVVITTVGVAAMVVYPSPLLLVPLSANVAGSMGDLWMAGVLLQYPRDVRVGPLPPERAESGPGREHESETRLEGDESASTDAESDDRTQGFGIYGPSDRNCVRRPGLRVVARVVAGAIGTVTVLAVATVGAVFASLAAGTGTVVIGNPDGWLLFRHELDPHGGFVFFEVGASVVVAIAAVGGLAWAGLTELVRAIGGR
ncbi:hypothetical protein C493_04246 [Natronolimnohabitans innermongolicus JCM 12255]|uniref:DUF3267 domain-containing protein n=1 Tax=Natronolimnohabitans innermongolicus JCM 12255 TaxID=1227499 RepID=L9XGX4_9EURY|nr:hypothetical protein C493_04246 [Natronolimnohabitans innermongolicus JCM 12255]